MKKVIAKLGSMRKAVDWVVYPQREENKITIQADARICQFDPKTGKGMLSAAKPSGAYFLHLSPALGATEVVVPADVIAQAVDAMPYKGMEIGPGVTMG